MGFRFRLPQRASGLLILATALLSALTLSACTDSNAKSQNVTAKPINPVGVPDPAFGSGGAITYPTSLGGTEAYGVAIAVDGSGRILVGGASKTTNVNEYEPTLWRLFSNGSPDLGFGVSGVTFQFNSGGNH